MDEDRECEYQGELDENDKPHGYGEVLDLSIVEYPLIYKGTWFHGVEHGLSKLSMKLFIF